MKCRHWVLLVLLLCAGCSGSRRIARMEENRLSASISLPEERAAPMEIENTSSPPRDTLKVTDLDGKEVLIMRAVRDEATGEMVATEQLDAAVVTARFRNVAERHGKVDLEFQVIVPQEMHDSKWQLRFHPDMFILEDSLRMDDVVITGADYRKAQMKGYQQYERFLSGIVRDTLKFVRMHELEVFLQRNLPQVYAFKNDSTEVSDEQFESSFGVTEHQAVRHYTNMLALQHNERKKGKMEKMWRRYVKAPIVTEGIRLDTVIRSLEGDFIYNYVQTINTRPKLRKVDIKLSGEIFEADKRVYTIPPTVPLTFYISSVSAFVDGTERYLTKVIARNVEANTVCNIQFKAGKWDIDENMEGNAGEIAFIKENLRNLLTNPTFELDSIIIVSSASPEGTFKSNASLTYKRASSASDYFSKYVDFVKDSLRREAGIVIDFDGTGETIRQAETQTRSVTFRSRSGGENWPALEDLVVVDTLMTPSQKDDFAALGTYSRDPDMREREMSSKAYYKHVRDDLYPRLRTVTFYFHLHRKGMQADTLVTSELDENYMAGVQAIRDHDYNQALEYLTPYQDYNTAVAYVAMDRNQSALSILKDCEKTAKVNYMLALIYSRMGFDQEAVQCFLLSCRQDPSFVHRGNLDPEISILTKRYELELNEYNEL